MPRYRKVVELSKEERENILKGILEINANKKGAEENLFSYIEGFLLESWKRGPKREDTDDEFEKAEYENW